jgi:hypothetical protein
MTDSWWAKKLGRAPAGQPSYGPTGPPSGSITPAGTQAQMIQQQRESGPPPVMVDDPDVPGGQKVNWRAWSGGQAHKEESGTCPNCGSSNYFSRRREAKVTQNGMATPAPQCFNCSYNGMFQIFGGD